MPSSRSSLVVALALAVTAAGVGAQEGALSTFTGHLVSADADQPIGGAWISLEGEDWGTVSWNDGHFELPEVPSGPQRYRVKALGYVPLTASFDPEAGDHRILLAPDPEVKPGLDYLLARLDNRRNGARVLDREALAYSGAYDLQELLERRGFAIPNSGFVDARQAPRACLDERSVPLGYVLSTRPERFYRIEGMRKLRIYTSAWLENMARQDVETIRSRVRINNPLC